MGGAESGVRCGSWRNLPGRPSRAALDRAGGNAELGGDGRLVEVEPIAQHDDRALAPGQGLQGALDGVAAGDVGVQLTRGGSVVCLGPAGSAACRIGCSRQRTRRHQSR